MELKRANRDWWYFSNDDGIRPSKIWLQEAELDAIFVEWFAKLTGVEVSMREPGRVGMRGRDEVA